MKKSTFKFIKKLMKQIDEDAATIAGYRELLESNDEAFRNHASIISAKNKEIENFQKLATTTYEKAKV